MIISLVRSLADSQIDYEPSGAWLRENLGFVTDEHQINVALTRAKQGLCIIGKTRYVKGQGMQEKFSFNLSGNIVTLQVERVVARINTACSTCHATNFSVASCSDTLRKVDQISTFCNNIMFSTCKAEICSVTS